MDLIAQKREQFGKAVNVLRRQGLVPAELYGHGVQNLHLSVVAKDFSKVFKQAGENTLVNVVFGQERHPVLINDVHIHPVTDQVLSVDFYQVRLDQKIKVKVAVKFLGEAPAVKEKSGILVKSMHEIEIEALPAEVPHTLDADLSVLREIGQSVYVKDLRVPSGTKILVSPETVIASVTAQVAEEEIAVAPEVTLESVKVETEEKKIERQAKKAAETPADQAAGQKEAKPKA